MDFTGCARALLWRHLPKLRPTRWTLSVAASRLVGLATSPRTIRCGLMSLAWLLWYMFTWVDRHESHHSQHTARCYDVFLSNTTMPAYAYVSVDYQVLGVCIKPMDDVAREHRCPAIDVIWTFDPTFRALHGLNRWYCCYHRRLFLCTNVACSETLWGLCSFNFKWRQGHGRGWREPRCGSNGFTAQAAQVNASDTSCICPKHEKGPCPLNLPLREGA